MLISSQSLRCRYGRAGRSSHGLYHAHSCPGKQWRMPPTQLLTQSRLRHVPRAGIASFPPLSLCPKAGAARLPLGPAALSETVLGQPVFPKCLMYRARTRSACATATHPGTWAHIPAARPQGNKVNGAGCHGCQQRQTGDTAGTTDQFIRSIPSSLKPENNFQQEMKKQ